MVSSPFSQHDFGLKQMDDVHIHSVGYPYGAISWHSIVASENIPICSVTTLGWPDLQVQIDPHGKHASDVFAEREFEKYTGAAARSGHFCCLCDSFTITNTGIPYCVHGRHAISSVPGSRDNYKDLGMMFSVCALRKHHMEFASCNKRIKNFPLKTFAGF